MSTPDPLLVERPLDAVVVLRLNRPQVRNALNLDVRARLADEVTRHAADEKIRCLIITGSDTVFAAGADIGQMAEASPV
ncbi:MAG TPA: enoyl-CoA hydratase-related protein, partial [Pseudolabrys sp.]|nr:enoyl-CoA hydratase-related protein [Pseudolabrys sp.]